MNAKLMWIGQAGFILKAYGQEMRVGFLVAQTMFREMGPFMTALILAASVGSGMAALLSHLLTAWREIGISSARRSWLHPRPLRSSCNFSPNVIGNSLLVEMLSAYWYRKKMSTASGLQRGNQS